MKIFRDPVHNIIKFDKDSEKYLLDLIDSREFQRLRQIKQLGLSSYTYPGAEHTRFAHSLGVTYLMKRFLDKLCSLKGDRFQKYIEELNTYRKVALSAALLHDIGHGPFSHALEKTTDIPHEKWTIAIIEGDTEVNSILKNHNIEPKDVVEIIQRTHKSKAVVKLLSSQLDTDRIDYLLRDSKMTGAGYGSFDLEWLIHVLTIGEVNGQIEVGVDMEKGLSIAEDFVMARYYMYVNVYFHKATRSAELIIDSIFKRALTLHKENNISFPESLSEILQSKNPAKSVESYLKLTDSTIWHYINEWSYHSDSVLNDLCSRMLKRNLFKSFKLDGNLLRISERINEALKCFDKPYEYYVLKDEAKSSSYKDSYIFNTSSEESDGEREASEQIFLFNKNGEGVELSTLSNIISQIRNKGIVIERYYAPEEVKNMIVGGENYVSSNI